MGNDARANGHGRTLQMPGPAVPIIGQPFQIESVSLSALVTGRCSCATTNPSLILGRDADGRLSDEPVWCEACGKGYRAVLQMSPQGQPHIGLAVLPPRSNADAELETTVLEDEPEETKG